MRSMPGPESACAFPCQKCGALMYIPVAFSGDAFRCDACGAMNPMREDWIAQLRAMASLAGKVTL